jgi:hypothetical protein
VLLLSGLLTSAGAQTKVADIVDLFSPTPQSPGTRGSKASPRAIPGMAPETIGAVSILSLSPAGTRSVRSARATAAQQRLRIALPNNTSLVCTFSPERRDSGVLVMRGTIEGQGADSRCNLYEEGGQITGDIDVESGRFAIVPLGSNVHAVVEVKTQAFPGERSMGKD